MPTIMVVQMIGSLILTGLCLVLILNRKEPK
jgi:hypothetical protein